jgi:hypothetical protein
VQRLWGSASKTISRHPFLLKTVTSGIGFGFGDVLFQLGTRRRPLDWRRTAAMGAAGLAVGGPVGYYFIMWMERNIMTSAPHRYRCLRFPCAAMVCAMCVVLPVGHLIPLSLLPTFLLIKSIVAPPLSLQQTSADSQSNAGPGAWIRALACRAGSNQRAASANLPAAGAAKDEAAAGCKVALMRPA